MKKITLIALVLFFIGFSSITQALSQPEAEEFANLAAVFVYLQNECGYNNLPNADIKQALVYFAQQNRWDLSNYNSFNMSKLGNDSYHDLRGIAISRQKKCRFLARSSLVPLSHTK
ncbi:YacC family pilotin-like protein [Candidatus Fukatsuia symbiotica]|uniref:YacC family pilotin-like protein n=1 Tax=Candidatus Fukatsuia symbiotica TaxID=1878942 RepID=A0A2U8I4C7_9GAMM|nr:YacC family pilotin-like protein [Candidatus Fukatsuia symbiotica]AWK14006.1 hypothetical protein CCS41_05160 [Candidatus Fukatsuia symbiotica]MEA9445641.1 YacC family pilotin-like protein [Candidatus Fukatsuia symbiotica]